MTFFLQSAGHLFHRLSGKLVFVGEVLVISFETVCSRDLTSLGDSTQEHNYNAVDSLQNYGKVVPISFLLHVLK